MTTQDVRAEGQGALILVVEDERVVRMLTERVLVKHGLRVITAETGAEAIQAVREQHPDLVLLDCILPDMDGYAVCQQLRADPQVGSLPIIFNTALNEPEDRARAFEVGGDDQVYKPLVAKELYVKIQHHLELARLRRMTAAQA